MTYLSKYFRHTLVTTLRRLSLEIIAVYDMEYLKPLISSSILHVIWHNIHHEQNVCYNDNGAVKTQHDEVDLVKDHIPFV